MRSKRRKKQRIRNTIIPALLLIVIGVALVGAWKIFGTKDKEKEPIANEGDGEGQTAEEDSDQRVSLFFMGDALLHESVYEDAKQEDGSFDFDAQLHYVTEIAKKYDLQYYNQETILGGTELGLSGYPIFNSPREFGEYMVSAGFNLVSTGNNHSLDKGSTGIKNSYEFWSQQEGVLMQGTNISQEGYDEIASIEVKGIRIAFMSYTFGTNGIVPNYAYEVNVFTGHEEEMLEKVRRAKADNDVVIMAMHWGDEYYMGVTDYQRNLAGRLVEAGADIIIGNHPHVIEPFEYIDGKPVFYACGNLISSQLDEENLIGLIGALDIVKEENEVKIENIKVDLVYTRMEGEYPALRYNIEVIPFKLLDDSILPGHQETYAWYQDYVSSLGYPLTFGDI